MKQLLIYGLLSFGLIAGTGCKLDYVNPNGAIDTQITTTPEGMMTLSIGIKQYYSAVALESFVISPGTTSREIKGITTSPLLFIKPRIRFSSTSAIPS